MKRICVTLTILFLLAFSQLSAAAVTEKPDEKNDAMTGWQQPSEDILDVLNAPNLPWVWNSPTGEYLFLADPTLYPPLSELALPVHKLAGIKVNPATNGYYGSRGGTSPRLIHIEDGRIIPLNLPADSEIGGANWSADGKRFALTILNDKEINLYTGSTDGVIKKVENIALNPLLGNAVSWLPDQKRLLVYRIPERGEVPQAPVIPAGPVILSGSGAKTARSTYESRDLLETAHDDALFEYYTKSELVIIDTEHDNKMTVFGKPDHYFGAEFSPDGQYVLIKKVTAPWSHEVAWWRFPKITEIWKADGSFVSTIAALPLANNVPAHGVTTGPRSIRWRPTAEHMLFWVEALDGGDPVAEVPFRDKLMSLEAPFKGQAKEIFKTQHRLQAWSLRWGEKDGLLMLSERERMKRWRYTWLLDVDKGSSRKWFDLNESDRYNNPGYPVMKALANGFHVMRQDNGDVYFRGSGSSDKGDRPFMDLRSLKTGKIKRVFRCAKDRYERIVAFTKDDNGFIIRSESTKDVPNYYLATLEKEVNAEEGEAIFSYNRKAITHFEAPSPKLRQITKKIVRYEREDGVPLSFQLYLPPNYKEGTALPTVIYAYPQEFSSAEMAGQVSGSDQRFMRLRSVSPLYFLLKGYAVLHRTSMPMIGDPETTYDTFVPQLVADAEAAINKAVELGVTDRERVGVIGHSHGGLMVANLLAHTDLFKAGIARSGSYNKTNQPFGFQAERRSLFKARDTYINVSPTFFADKINEPILIIHGKSDSNPGTLTAQSEVFYEAVRGSGGTTRLVLLPYEDHGYRAKETIEHVLWEQFRWFDKYLKK